MTLSTRALEAYAHVAMKGTWALLWLIDPWRSKEVEPAVNIPRTGYEWQASYDCESCGPTVHRFIEWIEEAGVVTTAECSACDTEVTV